MRYCMWSSKYYFFGDPLIIRKLLPLHIRFSQMGSQFFIHLIAILADKMHPRMHHGMSSLAMLSLVSEDLENISTPLAAVAPNT
jgi:hypothetical protein